MRLRPLRGRTTGAMAMLLVLAVAAGCGLPQDSAPRAIDDGSPGVGGTAPPTAPAGPTVRETVLYFVGPEALVKVSRPTKAATDAVSAVTTLLAGVTDREKERNLLSSIPPDTQLTGSRLRDGVLTLDLSAEMNGIRGDGATQAYAQMVYTATELPDVVAVSFSIEGKPVDVQSDAGNLGIVTRQDYRSLAPD